MNGDNEGVIEKPDGYQVVLYRAFAVGAGYRVTYRIQGVDRTTDEDLHVKFFGEVRAGGVDALCVDCDGQRMRDSGGGEVACVRCGSIYVWYPHEYERGFDHRSHLMTLRDALAGKSSWWSPWT